MSSNLKRHAFTVCQFIVGVCHQFGEAALFVGDKYTLCVDGSRGPRPVGFGRATASQGGVSLKLRLNPPRMNLVRLPEMLASLNDGAIGRLVLALPFHVQLDVGQFDYPLWRIWMLDYTL